VPRSKTCSIRKQGPDNAKVCRKILDGILDVSKSSECTLAMRLLGEYEDTEEVVGIDLVGAEVHEVQP